MVERQEPSPTNDAWIGHTLAGKYRLDKRLGEGGFGTAYLAADLNYAAVTGAERRVVVKVPHMGRGGDDAAMPKDFRKEAQALTRLEHAHIVKVHDVGTQTVQHMGQDREVPFLVLQYAAGKSLADRLTESGRQSIAEVLEWLPDIAKALDYLHAQHPPVLHRDVKPGNILFDAADSALLADFGIAKFFGTTSATGGLPGSPLYMAPDPMLVPEQAGTQALDARYDQYALAVTVYEALSGRFPHEPSAWVNGRTSSLDEHSASRLVYRKTTEAPTPLTVRAPQVSPPVSAVVARALSTKREQRYGSCREFATAFADAAKLGTASTRASSTLPPPPPPPPPSSPRQKTRPRWPWVAGTTAVAGIAAFLALRDRPSAERRDLAPPSPLPTILALDAPLEGAFVTSDAVLVSGQASGPSESVLTVNGTPVPVKGARFSTMVSTSKDGGETIRVEFGRPNDRTPRAETRHVVVDRTPPMLRITSPIDTSLPADATSVTIRGRVVDDHPASVVIGEATIPVTAKDGTFVVPDVALPTDATPSLRLVALDRGGLRSEALNLSFERAPTPPPAMAETPAPTPTPAPAAPPTPAPSVPPAVPPVEPPWKKFLAGWAEPVGSELDAVTGYPRRVKRTKDGMEMVLIPAGTFQMGAVPGDASAEVWEKPRHAVTIESAYYLDECEVTIGMWRAYASATGAVVPEAAKGDKADLPIHSVSWADVQGYLGWAGASLPTEEQWERAAKGGHDEYVFPWGTTDDPTKHAPTTDASLAPVKSYAPNSFGLYDMGSNAWEWCADESVSKSIWSDSPGGGHILRGYRGRTSSRLAEGSFVPDAKGRHDRSRFAGFRMSRNLSDSGEQRAEPPWRKFLAGWAEPVGSELDAVTGYPKRVKRTKDGMEMVLIPAGTFEMGTVPGDTRAGLDESPRHEVTISKPYYLDVNEVTVGAWKKFVTGGGGRMPTDLLSGTKDDFPIHSVDHTEATACAAWAGAALPTEAQWERAAKGGHEDFIYPWGVSDDVKKRNGGESSDGFTGLAPVRSFAPNDYGLYDMAGNLWEWCADWYGENFYGKSPSRDPSGPGSGSARVLRGGSFDGVVDNLRASNRNNNPPAGRFILVGFRLARSLD